MDTTIATVAYADVFDYPLTPAELRMWMIFGSEKVPRNKKYFFLKGRSAIVKIREERARYQGEKWEVARRAAKILSYIPSILLIGVTGGLAMNNARRDDDVDLFFIVQQNALWTTRFFATILMDIFGLRRHPNETSVSNKVCLNMFVTAPAVQASERDLFTAHEVLQMVPLVDRGRTYKKFLKANKWVRAYLPNAWKAKYDF